MKLFPFVILSTFLFTACSTVTFHPSNIYDNDINKLTKGLTQKEVRKLLQATPFLNDNTRSDGRTVELYTADYTSGRLIHCRNLVIIYDDNSELEYKRFVNGDAVQKRCNALSDASMIKAREQSQFYEMMNNTIQDHYSSPAEEKIKCVSEPTWSGGTETICEEMHY